MHDTNAMIFIPVYACIFCFTPTTIRANTNIYSRIWKRGVGIRLYFTKYKFFKRNRKDMRIFNTYIECLYSIDDTYLYSEVVEKRYHKNILASYMPLYYIIHVFYKWFPIDWISDWYWWVRKLGLCYLCTQFTNAFMPCYRCVNTNAFFQYPLYDVDVYVHLKFSILNFIEQ